MVNGQNQVIVHPAGEALYGESVRGPIIKLPLLDESIKKRVPYLTYEFKNFRTGKMDDKFVGFAYPTGYGNFPGLGWTVGAGADRYELPRDQSILEKFLRPLLEEWLR